MNNRKNNQQLSKNGFSCIFVFHFTKFIFSIILSVFLSLCMLANVTTFYNNHPFKVFIDCWKLFAERVRVIERVHLSCIWLCHCNEFGLKTNWIRKTREKNGNQKTKAKNLMVYFNHFGKMKVGTESAASGFKSVNKVKTRISSSTPIHFFFFFFVLFCFLLSFIACYSIVLKYVRLWTLNI